jgi:hypothetical protein
MLGSCEKAGAQQQQRQQHKPKHQREQHQSKHQQQFDECRVELNRDQASGSGRLAGLPLLIERTAKVERAPLDKAGLVASVLFAALLALAGSKKARMRRALIAVTRITEMKN